MLCQYPLSGYILWSPSIDSATSPFCRGPTLMKRLEKKSAVVLQSTSPLWPGRSFTQPCQHFFAQPCRVCVALTMEGLPFQKNHSSVLIRGNISGSDNERTDGPFSTERTVRSLIITTAIIWSCSVDGYKFVTRGIPRACKCVFLSAQFHSSGSDLASPNLRPVNDPFYVFLR